MFIHREFGNGGFYAMGAVLILAFAPLGLCQTDGASLPPPARHHTALAQQFTGKATPLVPDLDLRRGSYNGVLPGLDPMELDRPAAGESIMPELTRRFSNALGRHRDDQVVD